MPVKVTTRTRTAQTTSSAKSTPKKTASKAPATKTAARATPTRARKAAPAPVVKDNPEPRTRAKKGTSAPQTAKQLEKSAAKNNAALQERRETMNPRRKVSGMTYQQISDLSGYGLGTEQFITAVEVINGGDTKIAVSHRVAALLPETTRNGTPKQISNLVGSVIRNLESKGFTVSGTWKMVPPKA